MPFLAAVIFNVLIFVALTPLALRGVRYQPKEKPALLPTTLIFGLVFGLGGRLLGLSASS